MCTDNPMEGGVRVAGKIDPRIAGLCLGSRWLDGRRQSKAGRVSEPFEFGCFAVAEELGGTVWRRGGRPGTHAEVASMSGTMLLLADDR